MRVGRPSRYTSIAITVSCLLLGARDAHAQDLEPRAYSATPIGLNFLAASYSDASGSVSLDPSLPITGLKAKIGTSSLGFDHTFDLIGRSASIAIVVPETHGDLSGNVIGNNQHVSRTGLGDVRLRLAVNLLGGPALTPSEFALRQPTTAFGTSLIIVAPTGQYDPSRLINISSNRWALKPEFGLSQPLGKWFVDAYTGVWIYSENNDYFNGHKRDQAPTYTFQLHGGYVFRPNLWLAADATYYRGGQTSIDGGAKNDGQSTVRYGVTLSIPIASSLSTKLAWSSWLSGRNGGNYQVFGITLQYAWSDPSQR
jgi:hypothetical protein